MINYGDCIEKSYFINCQYIFDWLLQIMEIAHLSWWAGWLFYSWKVVDFRKHFAKMNLDMFLVKRKKGSLGVSKGVTTLCIYMSSVDLLDWFASILRELELIAWYCHLYSLTFLCLVCWFTSLSWEIEFGQLLLIICLGVLEGVAQR